MEFDDLFLAGKLKKCPCMVDPSQRKTVLKTLANKGINITYKEDTSTQSLEIVQICAGMPNGLDNLLKIIRFVDGGAVPVDEFEQAKFEYEQAALKAKLISWANQLELDELSTLYQETKANLTLPPPLSHTKKDVVGMIDHLWSLPDPKREAVFSFSIRLAQAQPDIAVDIEDWQKQLLTCLKLPETTLTRLQQDIVEEKNQTETLYLLVDVDLTNGTRKELNKRNQKFLLTISMWQDEQLLETKNIDLGLGDKGIGHNAIQTKVETELEKIIQQSDQADFQVEFIVPMSLLNEAVDQWKCLLSPPDPDDPYVEPIELGYEYPVVVRSWDRLNFDSFKKHWSKKCNCLTINPEIVSKCSPKHLYNSYSNGPNEQYSGVGLDFTPDSSPTSHLRYLLQAGLPVILWPRSTTSIDSDLSEMVLDLLKKQKPKKLPHTILTTRCDHNHELREHLTLLWDYPTRNPYPKNKRSTP